MTRKPSWGASMRQQARAILMPQEGEGKASRKVMYKKALYAMKHTSCKPFRKN